VNLGKRKRNQRGFAKCLATYIESKRVLRETEAGARRIFYEDISNKLRNAKDSKEFFKALSIFRNRRGSAKKITVPVDTFKKFFEDVYKITAETLSNEVVPERTEISVAELDAQFTIVELDIAIKKLGKNKAPGSDGVPNEIWKTFPENAKLELLKVFNELFDNGNFPDDWTEIIISPLFKKSDPALPSNYRPGSLCKTILKLYTQLLSNRLLIWSSKNKVISDYQAAYKKNSGCRNHVFLLTAALQYNFSINRKVYGLCVDMCQAFDTLNHRR